MIQVYRIDLSLPGFSFDEVVVDLSDESLVVVDAQLLEEGLPDLVDVANHHRREEDLRQRHRHRVDRRNYLQTVEYYLTNMATPSDDSQFLCVLFSIACMARCC